MVAGETKYSVQGALSATPRPAIEMRAGTAIPAVSSTERAACAVAIDSQIDAVGGVERAISMTAPNWFMKLGRIPATSMTISASGFRAASSFTCGNAI